ncbi:MAG: HD domain-containing protein [Eubacterium sp.]|nr:HD domain-containing protein [Eubacterium sp.]
MQEAGIKVARYFGTIVENRDYITNHHARRVGMISYVLAANLKKLFPEYGLDDHDVLMISSAATLHDSGKIGLPDRVINKPTKMNEQEYEIYKSHTYKGQKMFKDVAKMIKEGDPDRKFFELAGRICKEHHERYDGSGYPEGLKGGKICIGAQIVGLADSYDDCMSDRLSKKQLSKLESYDRILNGEYGGFSPDLLHVFKKSRQQIEQLLAKESS